MVSFQLEREVCDRTGHGPESKKIKSNLVKVALMKKMDGRVGLNLLPPTPEVVTFAALSVRPGCGTYTKAEQMNGHHPPRLRTVPATGSSDRWSG